MILLLLYFPPSVFLLNFGHNCRQAEGKYDVSIEEIRNIMEVMAASGKFW